MANNLEKDCYDKRENSNKMTRFYILASMSNLLQRKKDIYETAFEVMESLNEIYVTAI